ncbi:VOC family protein [Ahrensia kielensis]|uniref:VOC family protein n=1 Tax=Ahrensia kielensis TaxID=76980 RepID=UPI0003818C89|nr:VOC family protein [Ahrensia kielensis]
MPTLHASLEHVNFTVPDASETAAMLCKLFGWKIRWQGPATNGGFSVHVGSDTSYLAVYSPAQGAQVADINKARSGHLNHVGIVVDDLKAVEEKVKSMGYKPYNHADYEPGERFYFDDENGIEFEVVRYD